MQLDVHRVTKTKQENKLFEIIHVSLCLNELYMVALRNNATIRTTHFPLIFVCSKLNQQFYNNIRNQNILFCSKLLRGKLNSIQFN